MRGIDYVLFGMVFLIITNLLLMFVYCFIQEKLELFLEHRKKQMKSHYDKTNITDSISLPIIKRLYNEIQSFFGGLTRYNLMIVGKIPSHFMRKLLYKYVFRMKISMKTIIYGGCEIRSPWNISIGKSIIGCGCVLDGRSKIIIGDNVVFGSFVHIWTMEHDVDDAYFRTLEHNKQPVIIKDRAWICSDSTLLPGVNVGEGAVVASRACVTKDCEEFSVYGGVPARKIKDRNRDLRYETARKPSYRFY